MREAAAATEGRLDWMSAAQSCLGASPIRVRSCTEDDIPKVMRFFDQHWHAGHILSRDETLLRWQYHPGRAKTELFTGLTVVLAVMNGEIGGMLGLIPFDFMAPSGVEVGYRSGSASRNSAPTTSGPRWCGKSTS
jgi:hypothetical protein